MNDDTFGREREYTEKCPCGRILVTAEQAQGHVQFCDDLPADSPLLSERLPR